MLQCDSGRARPCTGLPWWLSGKESACQSRRCRRPGFDPWVGKIPWKRKWQPTPVSLPEKSHGQRSMVCYSPWVAKSQIQPSDWHFHFQCEGSWGDWRVSPESELKIDLFVGVVLLFQKSFRVGLILVTMEFACGERGKELLFSC